MSLVSHLSVAGRYSSTYVNFVPVCRVRCAVTGLVVEFVLMAGLILVHNVALKLVVEHLLALMCWGCVISVSEKAEGWKARKM
jgi:hypothetical protein